MNAVAGLWLIATMPLDLLDRVCLPGANECTATRQTETIHNVRQVILDLNLRNLQYEKSVQLSVLMSVINTAVTQCDGRLGRTERLI